MESELTSLRSLGLRTKIALGVPWLQLLRHSLSLLRLSSGKIHMVYARFNIHYYKAELFHENDDEFWPLSISTSSN